MRGKVASNYGGSTKGESRPPGAMLHLFSGRGRAHDESAPKQVEQSPSPDPSTPK